MHPEVLGVRVDMTAREAAGFLTENQIAGAPVLDTNGHLVGVVSLTDLAENEGQSDDVFVREIMTPTVYTVPDDTPVPEIARAMIAGRIHRLFVTCKRRVVGIVTPLDLLRLLTGEAARPDPPSSLTIPAAIRPPARRSSRTAGPRRETRSR
jgi:CBS domain-containing protein